MVARASDWNCSDLVDDHRSPVSLCSKTRSGSPVGIRTYYRLVTSGEISTLFSACRCFASVHSDTMKAPFASAKLRRKGTKSARVSRMFVHLRHKMCVQMLRRYPAIQGFVRRRAETDRSKVRWGVRAGSRMQAPACMQIAGVGMTAPQHVDGCGLSCW